MHGTPQAEGWRTAAEETINTETEEQEANTEQGWTKIVRTKKGLSTSARVFGALSESVAEVIPRKGDIPKAMMKHDGRTTWVDFRGVIYIYATYFWHSAGMSTRNEELWEKVWKPL